MEDMFDIIVVIQYLYKILHCQGFVGELSDVHPRPRKRGFR